MRGWTAHSWRSRIPCRSGACGRVGSSERHDRAQARHGRARHGTGSTTSYQRSRRRRAVALSAFNLFSGAVAWHYPWTSMKGTAAIAIGAFLAGCGGDQGAPQTCFHVMPDSAAMSVGAGPLDTDPCQFISRMDSDGSDYLVKAFFTKAVSTGPTGPSPDVLVELTYHGTEVVPVSLNENTSYVYDPGVLPSSGVRAQVGYTIAVAGGATMTWGCQNAPAGAVGVGVFQLDVTSAAGHGTLHAVCPPTEVLLPGDGQGAGEVTIDGRF
jgi:hypothetical protein